MSSQHGHAATASASAAAPVSSPTTEQPSTPAGASSTAALPHIRIVPHLDAPRSLHFEVVDKDVPEGFVIKIGRFTDKQALPNRVTFKSKVVSRGHAEIYTESGKFFIRDTKSSSGTFLNHARLSPPGVESKPTPLKDGDVIQLGVDYQGGTQEIYRCVKMRLELNRSWQQKANPFRMNTLKAIRSLTTADAANSTDCCICLFRIASFQSLFVAPCSHVYHYKCIRPMLIQHHPGFHCPLCRTYADLDDTVEIDDPIEEPAELPAENIVPPEVRGGPQEIAQEPDAVRQQELGTVAQPVETTSSAMEIVVASTPPNEPFLPQETIGSPVEPMQVDEVNEAQAMNLQPPPTSTSPSLPSSPSQQQGRRSAATTAPLAISRTASSTSVNSPGQQSPSSAFLMAPSPPMFVSSFGVTPIPFATPSSSSPQSDNSPSSSQQHHGSVSPSNHVGHMLRGAQNFVRNITIPHRNRSRTNSNSATSPTSLTGTTAHQNQSTGTEVLGKTLVMTPPLLLSSSRTATSHSGQSDLGAVSERDGEIDDMRGGHSNDHRASSSRSNGSTSSRSSSQSRSGSSQDAAVGGSDLMGILPEQGVAAESAVV
ncbi:hypothetical protein BGZ83_005837 [Gryganskiella cystojenkinii]|nr:hypothetical protein BGZ83_005837 [Gryganskiella cystojenkinii]